METQFFILGHVILYGICMIIAGRVFGINDDYGSLWPTLMCGLVFFIPLEAVYWFLHWLIIIRLG